MRADTKKNQTKVAKELAKDPLLSERQIAKKTGIGNGTVHRAKKELERSGAIEKNDNIIRIASRDLEDLGLIQDIERQNLEGYRDKGAKLKPTDLEAVNRIGERKQKRYSLLMGDATDKGGGEKAFEFKIVR